jgi:hypothetical protein
LDQKQVRVKWKNNLVAIPEEARGTPVEKLWAIESKTIKDYLRHLSQMLHSLKCNA